MIMDCYDERQYPCCLDIMTTAVEVYGGADEAVEHFQGLLARASVRTFSTVQVSSYFSVVQYGIHNVARSRGLRRPVFSVTPLEPYAPTITSFFFVIFFTTSSLTLL